jgi:hypothetical protein
MPSWLAIILAIVSPSAIAVGIVKYLPTVLGHRPIAVDEEQALVPYLFEDTPLDAAGYGITLRMAVLHMYNHSDHERQIKIQGKPELREVTMLPRVFPITAHSGLNVVFTLAQKADTWPIVTKLRLKGSTTAGDRVRWRGEVLLLGYRWEQQPSVVRLQARCDERSPYETALQTRSSEYSLVEHYLGIYNPPGYAAAQHVRLSLLSVTQSTRTDRMEGPTSGTHPVPMRIGGDPRVGITLRPGQEEFWRIGYSGSASDRSMMVTFTHPEEAFTGPPWKFDPIRRWQIASDTVGVAQATANSVLAFEPEEHWRLEYEIVADNATPTQVGVVVTAVHGRIKCRLG